MSDHPNHTRAASFILIALLIGANCHGIPLAVLWRTIVVLFVAEVTFWKRLVALTPTSVQLCSATCPCLDSTGRGPHRECARRIPVNGNIYLLKPVSYFMVHLTDINKSTELSAPKIKLARSAGPQWDIDKALSCVPASGSSQCYHGHD